MVHGLRPRPRGCGARQVQRGSPRHLTRCFIALRLDPEPGPALAGWLDELRAFPELSVPPPQNLHLTLAFLGELDDGGVAAASEAVTAAAARLAPWTVEWAEAGAFPSMARARVLWLGLADARPTVAAAAIVADELRTRALPDDERPFRPHLTVARVRKAVGERVLEDASTRRPSLPASRAAGLVLYASRMGRGPSVYTVLSGATFT